MSSPTDIAKLAGFLTTTDPPVVFRIALITAVDDDTSGSPVQTDQTSTAWLNRLEDSTLAIGDRVLLLGQGPVFIVIGRLSGEVAGPPIGAVTQYAGPVAPAGWLICNGAAISRATYAALFAVTGTTYGAGNGTTTFNLPTLTAVLTLRPIIRVS